MSDRRRIYVHDGRSSPERDQAPLPAGVERVSVEQMCARVTQAASGGALLLLDDGPALHASLPHLVPKAPAKGVLPAAREAVRILLLEDEASDAELVEAQLEEFDGVQEYRIEHHVTLGSGCEAARLRDFDIALVDIRLPDTMGVATVTRLREVRPELPIICLTGNDDEGVALACVEAGAHAYLQKSLISPVELRRTLIHTLARVRRQRLSSLEAARGYEAQLTRLNAELARSNRDLESFARVAAHDLSGPLGTLLQLTGWIARDLGPEAPASVRENLAMLERRLARLRNLVRDALTWAQAGDALTSPEPTALGELTREIFEECAPPAGFRLDAAPDLRVQTAHSALAQVLRNLISNALRHHGGASGLVSVHARWVSGAELTAPDSSAPTAHLRISVEDDGPGIEVKRRARAFEMGVTSAAMHGGTGMGLAIAKRIVTHAGGAIEVGEAPAGGAAVRFTWPAAPSNS